jgi:hypothetical protein
MLADSCCLTAKLLSMMAIIRNRFVAIDLAAGWIEQTRDPQWAVPGVLRRLVGPQKHRKIRG